MRCKFGKFAKLIPLLFLLPTVAQAVCSTDGYTTIFINGVFDTKDQADAEAKKLQFQLGSEFNGEPLSVLTGYNQTHLAGAGDLIESVFPNFDGYDLDTILLQLQPEMKTRKILLVGHSQGSVYANALYDYLIAHGEPAESVAVYDVATPASFVAGDGKYLTSSGDTAINLIRGRFGFNPLPANIDLVSSPEDALSKFPGHSFSGAYLAGAPDRIVSDIQSELSGLLATSSEGDCFSPPDNQAAYRLQQVFFSIADPAALAVNAGAKTAYAGAATAVVAVGSAVHEAYASTQNALSAITGIVAKPAAPESAPTNFGIVKSLYGSSLEQSEVKDLLDATTQGASPALAAIPASAKTMSSSTAPRGEVLGEEVEISTTTEATSTSIVATGTPAAATSTLLATSTEPVATSTVIVPGSISLGGVAVSQEPVATTTDAAATSTATTSPAILFNASTTPPLLTIGDCSSSLSTSFCLLASTSATASWSGPEGTEWYGILVNGVETGTTTATSTTISLADQASTTVVVIAYDASSTAATSTEQSAVAFLHPVVINEVAWAGTQVSSDDQWIELKNRTPYAIDASRFVLYAADGGAQYIQLSGTIPGYDSSQYPHAGFYLIERGSQVLNSISPNLIAQFDPLSASGEELILASAGSGTTTLDATPTVALCSGWCGGAASAVIGSSTQEGISPNTRSMERLNATTSGAVASNWGTNDTYTIYGTDTQNGRVLGSPITENSLQQPEAGWYCDPDTLSITSGSTYKPQSGNCTYLARFIGYPAGSAGGVYKGTVGSSTLISGASPHSFGRPGQTGRVSDDTMTGAVAGEQFFVAIWEPRTGFPNPNDSANFNAYFTTGFELDGTTAAPPHQLYKVVPFTYGS